MDFIDLLSYSLIALFVGEIVLVAFEGKHLDRIIFGTKKIIFSSIGGMFILSIVLNILANRIYDLQPGIVFLLAWVFLTPVCIWFVSYYNRNGAGRGPVQCERCKVVDQWRSTVRSDTMYQIKILFHGKEKTFTVEPKFTLYRADFIDVYFQEGALGLNYVTEFRHLKG